MIKLTDFGRIVFNLWVTWILIVFSFILKDSAPTLFVGYFLPQYFVVGGITLLFLMRIFYNLISGESLTGEKRLADMSKYLPIAFYVVILYLFFKLYLAMIEPQEKPKRKNYEIPHKLEDVVWHPEQDTAEYTFDENKYRHWRM